MPNSLLLGQATASNPLGWQPHESEVATCYHLVQLVVKNFWTCWEVLYTPTLVEQSKWHSASHHLHTGDVVIVADKNTIRRDYHLALVKDVFPGENS